MSSLVEAIKPIAKRVGYFVATKYGEVDFPALDGKMYKYKSPDPPKYKEGKPRRKNYKMRDIAEFHGVDLGFCIRCGEARVTEKAHVIDFAYGGPDTIDNIVPLCVPCHRHGGENGARMPIFVPGEEWLAEQFIAWSDSWDDYVLGLGYCLLFSPREFGAVEIP